MAHILCTKWKMNGKNKKIETAGSSSELPIIMALVTIFACVRDSYVEVKFRLLCYRSSTQRLIENNIKCMKHFTYTLTYHTSTKLPKWFFSVTFFVLSGLLSVKSNFNFCWQNTKHANTKRLLRFFLGFFLHIFSLITMIVLS